MKSTLTLLAAVAAFAACAAPALAQDQHAAHAGQAAAAEMASGEVRKVDKEAGKLTIKHGPLANLNMPPMSMAFRVKDPAWLDQVKVGDTIRFVAERIEGAFVVTRLEAAK
ncbi:RND transporter [Massilia sp. KIM]|uniref:copper-binding protein n=1 Tax=Massilia sp. KIM TaxID=1955422 RepID=UPI00098F56E0|nr:copper-binding protein [Massilia sp. KIM]OON62993.1 RND transporter [Massilia sp. KIM]